jgi:hypothetical protein
MVDQYEPRLVLYSLVYPALEFRHRGGVLEILDSQPVWVVVLPRVVALVSGPVRKIQRFQGVYHVVVV